MLANAIVYLAGQGRRDAFINGLSEGIQTPRTTAYDSRVPMFNCFLFIPWVKIDILAKLRIWAKVLNGSLHDTDNVLQRLPFF